MRFDIGCDVHAVCNVTDYAASAFGKHGRKGSDCAGILAGSQWLSSRTADRTEARDGGSPGGSACAVARFCHPGH